MSCHNRRRIVLPALVGNAQHAWKTNCKSPWQSCGENLQSGAAQPTARFKGLAAPSPPWGCLACKMCPLLLAPPSPFLGLRDPGPGGCSPPPQPTAHSPRSENIKKCRVKASPAEGPRRLHTNRAYAHLWGFSRKAGSRSKGGV